MSVKHLDHLNLTVSDFDATVAWYGRVFGFALVEESLRPGDIRFGVLRAGDAMLCIYEHPDRHVPADEEIEASALHLVHHFGLRVLDRARWEATLAREGLETFYNSPLRWPNSTSWYVVDPSGHEIEVVLWDEDRVAFA